MTAESRTDQPAWPRELTELFTRAITVSFASLTASGTPITVPLTPYVGDTGRTLDVSTGLTYPAKAERARRNPKVCLLYADASGSGLTRPPVALVHGFAAVRDGDLQANADRYVRVSTAKLPESTKGQPKFLLRRFAWYFSRIWIEVTPASILWWPEGNVDGDPETWSMPEGAAVPESDPPPPGPKPPAWLEPRPSWEHEASYALERLSHRDLTVVGQDGFPLSLPVTRAVPRKDGFVLTMPSVGRSLGDGPACVTFHDHPEPFTNQENRTFVGTVVRGREGLDFAVDRVLADWSLPGGRIRMAASFLAKGRRLAPRLAREAERRGQPVPSVRFPGEY